MPIPVARLTRRASNTRRRVTHRLVLPAFTSRDVTTWAILLGSFALFRAADLSYSASHATSVAELALPIGFWATGCYAVAWLLLVGVAAQRHFLMWAGHATAVVLYLGLAVGYLVQLTLQQDTTAPITGLLEGPWWFVALAFLVGSVIIGATLADGHGGRAPQAAIRFTAAVSAIAAFAPIISLDGSRGISPLLCLVIMHSYMATRMGPVPLTAAEMAR